MGTFAHIVAVSTSSKIAGNCVEAAFEKLRNIDEMMSYRAEASQLSGLNRQAHKGPVKVSEELFEVLSVAVKYSRKTDGTFDVTIGPVVDLWRKAEKDGKKPTEDAVAQARSKVGYEKLILNEDNKTVQFRIDGMRLDLGGIAKGYAIDLAVEAMKAGGAVGGMVDVGGDIRCFGKPLGPKDNWLVGLQDPDAEGGILMVLKLGDMAVATSGDYQRFVLIDGQRYSHILDPATNLAVRELSSVSIIAPAAVDADALATAVSVMGTARGLEMIEATESAEAILISAGPEFERAQTSGAGVYIKSE